MAERNQKLEQSRVFAFLALGMELIGAVVFDGALGYALLLTGGAIAVVAIWLAWTGNREQKSTAPDPERLAERDVRS